MNKKPIITAIESDNDGYLIITVKGKDAKRVARVVEYADEMLEALEMALEWIDAVPMDTPLPAMPGFDRDIVDELIAKAKGETE